MFGKIYSSGNYADMEPRFEVSIYFEEGEVFPFSMGERYECNLRRCWYEALILQPCLPTTNAPFTSIVGTLYTGFAAYQQRRRDSCVTNQVGGLTKIGLP